MFGYCVRGTYQVPVFSTAVPQTTLVIMQYYILQDMHAILHPTAAAMCPTTDTVLSMQCYFYEMSCSQGIMSVKSATTHTVCLFGVAQ